jgi:hypothetical protein
MKTIGMIYSLMAILILATSVSGEKVLSVFFVVHANDSVELKQVKVMDGKASSQILPGDYGLVIKDTRDDKTLCAESIKLSFETDEETPKTMDYTLVTLRIPYNPEMGYLYVYKGNKSIFSQRIFERNDSETVPVNVPAKKEESGYSMYLLLASFVLLIAALYIIYGKKQGQKIKKEREDFIKWKEAQERLKDLGKPSE